MHAINGSWYIDIWPHINMWLYVELCIWPRTWLQTNSIHNTSSLSISKLSLIYFQSFDMNVHLLTFFPLFCHHFINWNINSSQYHIHQKCDGHMCRSTVRFTDLKRLKISSSVRKQRIIIFLKKNRPYKVCVARYMDVKQKKNILKKDTRRRRI
jgi:hypothetical protein